MVTIILTVLVQHTTKIKGSLQVNFKYRKGEYFMLSHYVCYGIDVKFPTCRLMC
jgi:hypothetical protein